MLHDNDIHTPQHRALVCGALYMAFKDLGEVVEWVDALVVGLPVYSFGKFREDLVAEMGKGFEVPVPAKLRAAYGKDTVFVRAKAIKVMPQPVGAMTDWRGHVSVAITSKHPNARIDIQTVEDGLERGKLSLVGVGSTSIGRRYARAPGSSPNAWPRCCSAASRATRCGSIT